MKKLLILGNNSHVDELINNAKNRGVYTIVTDNLPTDKSPVKNIADEAWNISVTDLDALESAAKECGINGVVSGASEICLEANRELCKRLDLPFYASDQAWEISNDKMRFKTACKEAGISVAENYDLSIELKTEDIEKIDFPVVVKPADGYSSIGLHVCDDKNELISAYKDAYEKSKIKKVIVEKYITGEQMGLIYSIHKGEPVLIVSGDDVASYESRDRRVFGFSPTKHTPIYKEQLENNIKNLFRNIGCMEGIACLQFIVNDEQAVALEMNYRLPGGKNNAEKIMCNNILCNALSEDFELDNLAFNEFCAYSIWLKPGKIHKIEGVEEIKKRIANLTITQMKHEGDIIEENTGMRQIFGFIVIGGNAETGIEAFKTINGALKVTSDQGEDMICRYEYDKKGYAKPI